MSFGAYVGNGFLSIFIDCMIHSAIYSVVSSIVDVHIIIIRDSFCASCRACPSFHKDPSFFTCSSLVFTCLARMHICMFDLKSVVFHGGVRRMDAPRG